MTTLGGSQSCRSLRTVKNAISSIDDGFVSSPRIVRRKVSSIREMSIAGAYHSGAAMRRIAVIGPVASGKSTLARVLGSRLALPVIDLDDVYFGRDRRFSADAWGDVHRSLLKPERWVIAGDYRAVAGERFAAADTIVWLDLPRLLCSWRALLRPYPASKVDCLRWIWRYPTRGRKQTIETLSAHAGAATLVHLRSPREVRAFMARISEGASARTQHPSSAAC